MIPARVARFVCVLSFGLAGAGALAAPQSLPPPWLPFDPGQAHCKIAGGAGGAGSVVGSSGGGGGELKNGALRFAVAADSGSLVPVALDNGFTARAQPLPGDLFSILVRGGAWTPSRQFKLEGALNCVDIAPHTGAARAAERRPGVALGAVLRDPASGLRVAWRAVLRDGADYVREDFHLEADHEIDLARFAAIELELADATVAGTVNGSPVIAGDRFFGFAHPLSEPLVLAGHAKVFLRRVLPLRAGVPVDYEAVLGVAPAGQMRRGFEACLEDQRAAPFRTFLHYNSWFDIGYFTPYTEREAVDVIHAFDRELVRRRGVTMDSFLFDDGWDDPSRLWQFNAGFPDGFANVRAAAEAAGAEPGMWLSPWGGYGPPREARLKTARAAGYEVDEQGLALSGPKYYALFHDTTLGLLRRYGINQFKLDGTGSPDKVTPGSAFDSDFAAAIALIGDLRAVKPDLFINLTTGTWPSPFWLLTADSIWRDGEDTGFTGTGTSRQRWITYRDAYTYGGIVRLGPLFPLNSVMLHGIVYARKAQGLASDPGNDFADEVWSYFATGTGLQELYVSPDHLADKDWDTLAAAAKWARARAETLRDSHWIGGDPARGQVYGWASWSPARALIALRNPSARPQAFDLDPAAALELPRGASRTWLVDVVHASPSARPPRTLGAGVTRVDLAPYEVRVWDLQPASAR
jgi:hypothetical protein